MQNLGGQIRCIMGNVKLANRNTRNWSFRLAGMESACVFSVGLYLSISLVLEPKISIFNIFFKRVPPDKTLCLRACLHRDKGKGG